MAEIEITRRDLIAAGVGGVTGFGLGFGAGAYSAISQIDTGTQPTPTPTPDETPSDGTDTETDTETPTPSGGQELTLQNRPRKGSNSAAKTMVYWSDYQCPYCTQFEQQTFPQLQSNFIESGDVHFVLKPLTLFGPDSQRAVNASYAVYENYDSSTFWEWHKLMFDKFSENERNNGWAEPSELRGYIENNFNQIDPEVVASAVETSKYSQRPQVDLTEAESWNFEGTPFFILFKGDSATEGEIRRIVGAQPYSEFEQTITNF